MMPEKIQVYTMEELRPVKWVLLYPVIDAWSN